MKLDPQKTGMGVACFAFIMHLLWVLFIVLGLAQAYADWIFSIHFVNNPLTVMPFDIINALMLLVAATVIGFVIGWLFATTWNFAQKYKI